MLFRLPRARSTIQKTFPVFRASTSLRSNSFSGGRFAQCLRFQSNQRDQAPSDSKEELKEKELSIDRTGLKGLPKVPKEKPAPSPFEQYLINSIKAKGPLSLKQYMREVLTNPKYGYYMNQDVFGKAGDFITSPDISQMFGELVGIWFVHMWEQMGKPTQFHFVELGPGRGTLIKDILRISNKFPSFQKAMSVHLVEVSPFLRRKQASALNCQLPESTDLSAVSSSSNGIPITWHYDLASVPQDSPNLVLAHEFVDCLPVHHFQFTERGWCERLVELDESTGPLHFRFVLSPQPTAISRTLLPRVLPRDFNPALGTIIEVSPEALAFIQELSKRISQTKGVALIIDYGEEHSVFPPSIRAIRDHKFVELFEAPGTADLSCLVDFQGLKNTAKQQSSIRVFGPALQGEFLKELGIGVRLNALLKKANEEQAQYLISGFHRLVDPEQMGSTYKALALLHSSHAVIPVGFLSSSEKKEEAPKNQQNK